MLVRLVVPEIGNLIDLGMAYFNFHINYALCNFGALTEYSTFNIGFFFFVTYERASGVEVPFK